MNKQRLVIWILSGLLVLAAAAAVQQHVVARRLAAQLKMFDEHRERFAAIRSHPLYSARDAAETERPDGARSSGAVAGSDAMDAGGTKTAASGGNEAAAGNGADAHAEGFDEKKRSGEPMTTGASDAGRAAPGAHSGQSAASAGQQRTGMEGQERNGHGRQGKGREATAQAIERSKALLAQAQAHVREGDYTAAEELLHKSLEQDSGNTRAWKEMAQLQRRLGLTDMEIETYQRWMDTAPEDSDPYYLMAEAYARVGMDAEARQYLTAYESMANDTMGDYVRMSHLYRTMNAREDEGRILSQWMNKTPESVDAQRAWADYQRRMGNFSGALAQYEAIASTMPDNPMPYTQMAEIYRRNGDYATAQQHYETALALRPGDISTMNRLADARYASGDLQGAINVYAEIMALEPGSRAAEQAERRALQIQRQLEP